MVKINLDEILYNHVYSKTDIRNLKEQIELTKEAMLDFGKQLLELAAENAEGEVLPMTGTGVIKYGKVNKQSILDTIKQIE